MHLVLTFAHLTIKDAAVSTPCGHRCNSAASTAQLFILLRWETLRWTIASSDVTTIHGIGRGLFR
jgi:hypothetical protein